MSSPLTQKTIPSNREDPRSKIRSLLVRVPGDYGLADDRLCKILTIGERAAEVSAETKKIGVDLFEFFIEAHV